MLLAVIEHLLFLRKKSVSFQILKETERKKTRQAKLALCFQKDVITLKRIKRFQSSC